MTERIRVYGIVQGVGFRPTVSRHAMTSKIRGSVSNCGPYVEIIAQGTQEEIDTFVRLLEKEPPKRAVILKLERVPLEDAPVYEEFEIIESAKTKGAIFISPDIAICDACKEELYTPTDQRYLHPFINCTCCGPRLTILDALPYDRERTSMKEFPMCPECHDQYYSPESRRYDAQPVCCNKCGPQIYELKFKKPEAEMPGENKGSGNANPGSAIRTSESANAVPDSMIAAVEQYEGVHMKSAARLRSGKVRSDIGLIGSDALTEARRIISEGGIVAIKGIGGFHLCCDATNEEAVQLLRIRKTRPMKPFAVMMRSREVISNYCEVAPYQEEVLTGHQKPIVLLKRKKHATANPPIAEAVAPDNPKIGVMLPYAPVQMLLFDYPDGITMPDVLVMTSANASGAPICRDDEGAVKELGHLVDFILSHDRLIRIRADDTVMDFYEEKPYMIRRSRGYAPLPFMLSGDYHGHVLGIGGELKNSFCLGVDDLFYPSPYVGDLGDVRTVMALKETVARFQTLLEVTPELVACDLHPSYNSTAVAEELGLPLVKIQHHYAHILSCMAENDVADPVIGVSFDGTGYGTDGSIWGGEFLICDLDGFRRIGSITPFAQSGGDASSREGWRVAVNLIYEQTKDKEAAIALAEKLNLCQPKEAKIICAMADMGVNTVRSTSAGRLFDAVSALVGVRNRSTFEGEASTALQFCAERWMEDPDEAWRTARAKLELLPWTGELMTEHPEHAESFYTRSDKIVAHILDNVVNGVSKEQSAYEFHALMALQILAGCLKCKEETGLTKVALSGGVFQNLLLTDMVKKLLEPEGFTVLLHSLVPPNDGGIALGQAYFAQHRLNNQMVP